jgi:hypothetical protein
MPPTIKSAFEARSQPESKTMNSNEPRPRAIGPFTAHDRYICPSCSKSTAATSDGYSQCCQVALFTGASYEPVAPPSGDDREDTWAVTIAYADAFAQEYGVNSLPIMARAPMSPLAQLVFDAANDANRAYLAGLKAGGAK